MTISESDFILRLGAGMVMVLAAVGLASGELIDDFNDGNDDGWTVSDVEIGEPWDPPSFDASSGSYHLLGGGVVPVGEEGAFWSAWDVSSAPRFSNGFMRATVRANNNTTIPALILRENHPDSWYMFAANPARGRFGYNKYVSNELVAYEFLYVDEPFLPGQDWIIEAGAVEDLLSMKVWRVGEQEPAEPQWTLADSPSLGPGLIGLGAFHWANQETPAGIVDATFDDVYFQATPPVGLAPGDADQDLDFDQLDLVQVQVAAKYLTGQPATWGEGDWDGAPGGEPGNPPAGDGVFNQLDIVAALGAAQYLAGPYAAIQPNGTTDDEQTSVIYNAFTAEMGVDAPAGKALTSINIDSVSGIFTGDPAQNLGGSFDNDTDNNIFKATFGTSFGSLSFGPVARSGLSEEFLVSDLTVVGSLEGGGDLAEVDLVYTPEPSAMTLLGLGLVGSLVSRRRRWS